MIVKTFKKDKNKLFPTPIPQQTAYWSNLKQKLGNTPIAIEFNTDKDYSILNSDNSKINDILIILQHIDNNYLYAYVPYGPVYEPYDEVQGKFLEELSECIRSYLPSNCLTIRYDLCWESPWAKDSDCFDHNGFWKGEPNIDSMELRLNFNTVKWNLRKSYFNILPSNTVLVNLLPSENDILMNMKPKTRYNIRLAGRKNVIVKTLGIAEIDIWYELYKETAIRNNIYLNDINYFKAVLTARANDSLSPAEVLLLVAEVNNTPLSAMFLIITGNRGSYLYGASSNLNRNYMASYALQWEAIKVCKQKSCIEYDMFGVAPNPDTRHPMYGLYKFKTGFGGDIFHRMGCWDYPILHEEYEIFRAQEICSKGFHV